MLTCESKVYQGYMYYTFLLKKYHNFGKWPCNKASNRHSGKEVGRGILDGIEFSKQESSPSCLYMQCLI